MQTTQTAPQGKDTASQAELYMSLELADKTWQLTIGDGRRGPSRYTVDAGDTVAVLECLTKARMRCSLSAQCKIHSCCEAGRDGWWLHRWLVEQGIDNIVVDAASIEVNRRARRAETDRLDGDKLLAMLLRHQAGDLRAGPADRWRLPRHVQGIPFQPEVRELQRGSSTQTTHRHPQKRQLMLRATTALTTAMRGSAVPMPAETCAASAERR
jgi:hypothetical protein